MSQTSRLGPYQNEFRYVFFTPNGKFAETVSFYSSRLGLPYKGGFGDEQSPMQGAYIQAACGVLEIIADRQGSNLIRSVLPEGHDYQPPAGGYVLIEVDNVNALYTRLEEQKQPFLQPLQDWPWGFRDFKVQDPCGNTICLFSRVSVE